MVSLRLIDFPRFYQEVTLLEFAVISVSLLGVILFFNLIKYFFSKLASNEVEANDFSDNVIISPFMIKENKDGNLVFNKKESGPFYRIIAVILIIFMIITPLNSLLGL